MSPKDVYEKLLKAYGRQGWWPLVSESEKCDGCGYHKGEYGLPETEGGMVEVMVGAVLAQNTSWKNAEKSLLLLKEKQALERGAIEKIPIEKLALLIRSSGFFNQKAERIKHLFGMLSGRSLKGFFEKADVREKLLAVKGIGPETADSILLYAGKKPFFVADSYARRIFSRLGLCKEKVEYEALKESVECGLPKEVEVYNEFHALLVEHGKRLCRKNPLCGRCPLKKGCKYAKKPVNQI
ncbi:MAG TPA: hypothetical protein VFE88_03300 [Candidatus Nanoarchaeia archaeon]|nr:hypothetical protein [Candidatus Nanoarchaeia archaeon]